MGSRKTRRAARMPALLSLAFLAMGAIAVATAGTRLGAAVTSPFPDYIVERIEISPSPARTDRSIVFVGRILNISTTRATTRTYASLQLDIGNNGTWDRTGGQTIVPSLSANYQTSAQWANTGVPPPLDWTPTVGTHNVKICAAIPTDDPDFQLQENDTVNNCTDLVFTVTSPGESTTGNTSSSARSNSSSVRTASSSSYWNERTPTYQIVSSSSAARSSSYSSSSYWNERNDYRTVDGSSSSALPDYVIPYSRVTGYTTGHIDFNVTVENRGSDAVGNGGAYLQYKMYQQGEWVDLFPSAISIPTLAAGERREQRWTDRVTQEGPFPVGVHMVRACVDTAGELRESESGNNCGTPLPLTINRPPSTTASSRSSSPSNYSSASSFSSYAPYNYSSSSSSFSWSSQATAEGTEDDSSSSAGTDAAPQTGSPSCPSPSFTDAVPEWASAAINRLTALGIVRGYDDGRFGPSDQVTRAQAVTMLYRLLRTTSLIGEPQGCVQEYNDVSATHFAFTPLCGLLQEGRMDAAASFAPDRPATRAEQAGFVHRIAGDMLLGSLGLAEADLNAAGQTYPDVPPSHPHFAAIAAMQRTGIMTGYPSGNFGPSITLNRAEAAMVVYRVLTFLEQGNMVTALPTSCGSASSAETWGTSSSRSSSSRSSAPWSTASSSSWGYSSSYPNTWQSSSWGYSSSYPNTWQSSSWSPYYSSSSRGYSSSTANTWQSSSWGYSSSYQNTWQSSSWGYSSSYPNTWQSSSWSPSYSSSSWGYSSASSSYSPSYSSSAGSSAGASSSTPDYAASNLYAYPAPIVQGSTYSFTFTAKNQGDAYAKWSHARYDIDTGANGTYDYTGVMYAGVDPLVRGQTRTITWSSAVLPPKVPWTPIAGTHRVRICVNVAYDGPQDLIGDTNSANNCAEATFTVVAPAAASSSSSSFSSSSSLASSSSSVSSSASVPTGTNLPNYHVYSMTVEGRGGGTADVAVAVRNRGLGDETRTTKAKVMFGTAGTGPWTEYGTMRDIPGLVHGTYHVTDWFSLKQPNGQAFAPGTYYMRVCADATEALAESSEVDNCGALPFTIPAN
ncbi:MAG: S-layer homology domain-containing protein [Candidatus Peribacteraceae bacterium]|jgi:hypothetical protein